MKKIILAMGILMMSTMALADSYYHVSGMEALKNQAINQYDDVSNPPQGYIVTLPQGYVLTSVDVESGGSSICSVTSYKYKTQTVTIDGLWLETDEPGCTVILTILNKSDKSYKKVQYYIEQVGT